MIVDIVCWHHHFEFAENVGIVLQLQRMVLLFSFSECSPGYEAIAYGAAAAAVFVMRCAVACN